VGEVKLLFARGKLLAEWRIWALFRVFLLYIVLFAAQFIFLININPDTVFRSVLPLKANDSFIMGGISDFQLIEQKAFPFGMYEVGGFLRDPTRVKQLPSCKQSSNPNCTAYALVGNLGVAVMSDDFLSYVNHRIETEKLSVRFPSIPVYVVEFTDDWDPNTEQLTPETAHCFNHTNPTDNFTVRFCLTGSDPRRSSHIHANLQFCFFANCAASPDADIESEYWWDVAMTIERANASVVINPDTNEILETPDVLKRVPYDVNIDDYFTAFIAPFTYNPWNLTAYIEAYANESTYWNVNVFSNSTPQIEAITATMADQYVEFLAWSIYDPVQSLNHSLQLHSFLAYALAANSAGTLLRNSTQETDVVAQSYHLDLDWRAVISLVVLYGFMFVCTAMMLVVSHLWKKGRIPNTTCFPDLTLAARKGSLMQESLDGLSNAKSRDVLKKLKTTRVYVGPVIEMGLPRVALSTKPFPQGETLTRGVEYF
jgi:hypothetical protein